MSNLPLGAEHDANAPYNEEETYECTECGKSMSKDRGQCSDICFKASMI